MAHTDRLGARQHVFMARVNRKERTIVKRACLGVVAVAAAVALVAGCGGRHTAASAPAASASPSASVTTDPAQPFDGLDGDQVAGLARTAMNSLTSVTVRLSGAAELHGTAQLTRSGSCRVRAVLHGGSGDFIIVGDRSWTRGDKAFWRSQGAQHVPAEVVQHGRWWERASSAVDLDVTDLCSLPSLIDRFIGDTGAVNRDYPVTLDDGRVAVPLEEDGPRGIVSSVLVAVTGRPYFLHATETGSAPGTFDFAAFNAPLTITPPQTAQVAGQTAA
jgi:hypothetical protein